MCLGQVSWGEGTGVYTDLHPPGHLAPAACQAQGPACDLPVIRILPCSQVALNYVPWNSYAEALNLMPLYLEMGPLRRPLRLNEVIMVK